VEEEGGELTLKAKVEVLSEVAAIVVLEILVEEVKTQILVSQMVRELKNQTFNSITIKSMEIMHMSEKKDSIMRTSKVRINQTTQITKPILCLWCMLR
jgi:hypothetical protein